MGKLILGVGDFGASNVHGDTVETYALGSCIAIVLLDPDTRTIGMVHVALPDSSISPKKAKKSPGHFADSGIPALLDLMYKKGFNGNTKKLVVKIAGGAHFITSTDMFKIGIRNKTAILGIFRKQGMTVSGQDVGGTLTRTVKAYIDSGRTILSSPGLEDWEI